MPKGTYLGRTHWYCPCRGEYDDTEHDGPGVCPKCGAVIESHQDEIHYDEPDDYDELYE